MNTALNTFHQATPFDGVARVPIEPRSAPQPNRSHPADERSFEAVVRENSGRMLARARRIMGNEDDARDIVQEAFLLAFRSWSRFERRSSTSTWLHRIVVNTALTKVRSRSRRPECMVEDVLPDSRTDGRSTTTSDDSAQVSVASSLERKEARAMVRRCIDRLPDGHRSVLVLRDMEERCTEDVAQRLGIQPGTVKVRLHRARRALRALVLAETVGTTTAKSHFSDFL